MAKVRATFTFDQATISRLEDAADHFELPKGEVVRQAILEFHDRIGKLSERERLHLLRTFDEVIPRIPSRDASDVARELRSIRRARRAGGRKSVRDK